MANRIATLFGGFPITDAPARARNILHVTASNGRFTAYHDCLELTKDMPAEAVLTSVSAGLNNAAINECDFFAVHSGVARSESRIVALPAASGHGKTTLTGALVRAGFDYLSDEALVFEDDGSVHPYPKPLALSTWSAELLGVPIQYDETLTAASDLGGKVGAGGKLTDLILSEYGHPDVKLEPLPQSQAVAALIEYSFNHYKDPARAFHIATEVARGLNVWRLEYDHPVHAAELISNTLA